MVLHHRVYLTRPAIGNHRAFEFGYLGVWGVNCFFVLSGYLLGRPYLAMLFDPKRPIPSTRLFYYRRFLRIYPLYAVAILFSLVAVYLTYSTLPSAADIGAHLLMLHTFNEQFATSLNGPLWTMSVDAEFYALLPLCAASLSFVLRGQSRERRVAVVFGTLALLFVGAVVFRFVILKEIPQTVGDFAAAVVYIRNVVGFAGTFALGLFLAAISLLYRDRMPRRPVVFTSLVVVGIVIALLQLVLRMDTSAAAAASTGRLLRLTFNEALAAISVSLIFFGLSEARLPFITRLTGTKFVTSAAALAYAIYLVHWPIIDGVSAALHRPQGLGALARVGAISIVIVVAVAYVLHRVVERPILAIKDNLRDVPAR